MNPVMCVIFCFGCLMVRGNGIEVSKQINNFGDVPIHSGFKKIGVRFPQKILDIQTFQSDDLNRWYQITLQVNEQNNSLVLQKFDGKDFEKSVNMPQRIDVEKCRKFSFFKSFNLRFIIAYDCIVGDESMHIYLLDDEINPTSKKISPVQMKKVNDVIIWDNPTISSSFLMVIGLKSFSSNEGAYYFRFDPHEEVFINSGYLKMSTPVSVIPFAINSERYLAVASQRDQHGDFSDSQVYIQSDSDGRLIKFQKLHSKGITSITYFNFIKESESEHFLVAALDHDVNIKKGSKLYNEFSVIYKFDGEFFTPFQTLPVTSPTKFIFMGSIPVLITLSMTDGMVSYQYDGWRFSKIHIDQQIIENESLPGELRAVSTINGDFITFVSSKGETTKKFFQPTFNISSLAYETFYSDLKWCENTNKEIKLVKKRLHNYYPYGDECNSNKVYTDEEKIYALIYQAFKYVHEVSENEITDEEVMICCGREADKQRLNNNSNLLLADSQESEEKISCGVRMEFSLKGVSNLAALSSGLVLRNGTDIVLHPTLMESLTYDQYRPIKLGQLKQKNMIVTQVSKVDLCSSEGVYLEGVDKGKMYGGVYEVNGTQSMNFVLTLSLSGRSTVRGVCMNNIECFMVTSKTKNACSLQCLNVYRPFYCDSTNSLDILKTNVYTLVSVNLQHEIVVSHLRKEAFYNIGRLNTAMKSPKIMATAKIQQYIYTLIRNESVIELCRFPDRTSEDKLSSECEEIKSGIPKPVSYQLAMLNNEAGVYLGDMKTIELHLKQGQYFKLHKIINHEHNHFTSFNLGNKSFIAVTENVDYVLYSLECQLL